MSIPSALIPPQPVQVGDSVGSGCTGPVRFVGGLGIRAPRPRANTSGKATVTTALLVVDIQNGVAPESPAREETVRRVVDLVDSARAAGAAVVWVQHDDDELPHGTPAWELVAGLVPAAGDGRVSKQHRSAFSGTGLTGLLKEQGVDHVVVVGAQSLFCVDMAGKHALAEGFDVTLVSDGHFNGTTETEAGPIEDALARAMVNRTWQSLRHPGATVRVLPAAQVSW